MAVNAGLHAAMWTPLPPERSGIADYSFELLEALKDVCDVGHVTAVNDRPETAATPPGVGVVSPEEANKPGMTHLYHMGNHAGAHAGIHRRALDVPGIVVLHDLSLLDFYAGLHGGVSTKNFMEEVRYAHGPIWGTPHDPALLDGWPAIEVDGVKTLDRRTLSLERRLVTASRGVLVHDPHSAGFLRARYPGMPVHVVPSGAPVREDGSRAAARARLGWHDDHVVFGIFGGLGRIKRVSVAVLAFAELRRRWPQARLVIAGHADASDIVEEVRRMIGQIGAADSAHLALSPAKGEFEDLITATDVVVNLRWPTAGETSAVMMRALGAGKPVITSDLPQHRHLDRAFCWPVSTEPGREAEELYRLLERAVGAPDGLRAAGALAREYVRAHASWPVVARAYAGAMASIEREGGRGPARVLEKRRGVNVFADAHATSGLAESARLHISALQAAGVDLAFTGFNSRAVNRTLRMPAHLDELRRGKEFPVDLWLLNLNEFWLIPEHALDRYTIGLWAWELPELPDNALSQLSRVDELWVVSSYVADACRTATDLPIRVVPNVVPQAAEIPPDRARFGLPAGGLVVLFTFSASSSDSRKNPWAVIEAFRQAFGPRERGTSAHLVLKVNDLDRFPELSRELSAAVASVDGTLLREEMSREEMDRLLATCDIYLSLHRSEGFGRGIAEAMALGKPVIATGYGGNVDFMPPGSAAVVGYDIRRITERDHRFGAMFGDWYKPGQLWAEPDVRQAARWLRRLAGSERRRRELGARGAAAVRARCSPAAVGAVMAARLAELDSILDSKVLNSKKGIPA